MQSQITPWQETAEARDPGLVRLRRRWHAWRVAEALPLTIRYHPQEEPELLPWTMLVDIERKANPFRPFDLRSRFIGSAVGQYFSVEGGQHLSMSEIGPPFAERWFAVVDRILAARDCCCFNGAPHQTGFDFLHFEMLVLPFTTDGAALDSLLAAFAVSMFKRAD